MASLSDLAEKYKGRTTLALDGEAEFTPSGSVVMDTILSSGRGLPNGKWIQMSGESGCGKSHIVLTMAKQFCKQGKKVVYIDTERGVNTSQLEGLGLTEYVGDKFLLFAVATVEEAEEVMDAIVEDEEVGLIIIDSITGLLPEKIVEKSSTSAEPGLQARAHSVFIQKYRIKLSRTVHNPTVLLINQLRTKISFVATTQDEAGGLALKYYSDIRLKIRKKGKLTKTVQTGEGKQSIEYGSECEVCATKNRYAPPFVKAVVTVIYGKGVSNLAAYQRVLMTNKVMKMSGGGFWSLQLPDWSEPKKARGSSGAMNLIKENFQEIKVYVDSVGGFILVEEDE